MGKPTGFKEWGRELPKKREKSQRIEGFGEFIGAFDGAQAKAQGGRCMDCGVPFCMQGCPLGNRIPDWNDLVYRDRWKAAFVALETTNNFPELTGRLCPAPCEAACVLNVNREPVTIEQIEKEIVERAFAEGWVVARPPRSRTGKQVAVVGSGPAGLAAAQQLNRAGHGVTVFEQSDRLGGLLRYGIPDFKLDKRVIDRRLAILAAEGVRFQTGVAIGSRLSWSELRVRHDAVLIAIGAGMARDLEVPGRELGGVHWALDYLTQQNKRLAGDAVLQPIDAKRKRVVILGGGDTGSDCLGTAHRQGAAEVTQLEVMPALPSTRTANNPWPSWPLIHRTSSSQEEGGERRFALLTTHLSGKDGVVQALHARPVRPEVVDGRMVFLPALGGELTIPCDLVILAMGFVSPVADALSAELGLALDARGNVKVDADFRTSAPGVYAAGDARRGASLIVWAIADGREAARSIDAELRLAPSALPTRGVDQPFDPP